MMVLKLRFLRTNTLKDLDTLAREITIIRKEAAFIPSKMELLLKAQNLLSVGANSAVLVQRDTLK